MTGFGPGAAGQEPAIKIAPPVTLDNLSIYFVHGESSKGPVPLTLSEALAQRVIEVSETGQVSVLKVTNRGARDVFIQSGDIVKGGQQDRVLSVSLLIPANSGPHAIDAYCVEQQRWAPRGREDAKTFASANEVVPSRTLKLALRAQNAAPPDAPLGVTGSLRTVLAAPTRTTGGPPPSPGGIVPGLERQPASRPAEATVQGKVWDEVSKVQARLASNLGQSVKSPVSASSLQLSLETETVRVARARLIKHFVDAPKAARGDVIGVVVVINGRLNGADLYPSAELFHKLWPKLLQAAVTEALSEQLAPDALSRVPDPLGSKSAAPDKSAPLDGQSVLAFLSKVRETPPLNSDVGPPTTDRGALMRQTTHDAPTALYTEMITRDGQWIHRSYVAKD